MPDGGSAELQQVPRASTATPLPLHTPHASITPDGQQRPEESTTAPGVQHCPLSASMNPVQHTPTASTMPSLHAVLEGTAGTSQASPTQFTSHVHTLAAALHTQWLPGQSVSTPHVQGADGAHCIVEAGASAMAAHAVGGATLPSTPVQVTVRD